VWLSRVTASLPGILLSVFWRGGGGDRGGAPCPCRLRAAGGIM